MTTQKFEEIVNSRIEKIRETLLVKGKEYSRNNDVLHNFRKAAIRLNTTMEAVCWQHFCEKHLVSLDDIINDTKLGKFPSKDKVDEKLGDIIVYGFLLEACFDESIGNNKEIKNRLAVEFASELHEQIAKYWNFGVLKDNLICKILNCNTTFVDNERENYIKELESERDNLKNFYKSVGNCIKDGTTVTTTLSAIKDLYKNW
jgi:hypothetical protein